MLSTYAMMWDRVKQLDLDEQKAWLRTIGECSGRIISFQGLTLIDIDLAEALRFMVEEKK